MTLNTQTIIAYSDWDALLCERCAAHSPEAVPVRAKADATCDGCGAELYRQHLSISVEAALEALDMI